MENTPNPGQEDAFSSSESESLSPESLPEINEIVPDSENLDSLTAEEPGFISSEFDMPLLEDLEEPSESEVVSPLSEEDAKEFEEIFNASSSEAATPLKTHPAKKGRPRRVKGEGLFGIPNILATAIWAAVTLAVGITLGRLLWVCATDVLAFGRQDRQVSVTIYESDTIDDITQKLYDAKLIRYPGLFKFYAKFAVDDGEIKPGMWDLNTMYDYHALVKMMAPTSTKEVVKVMIPEGYTCRQIFELLQDSKVCTMQDIAAYAANGELEDFWFLENVERGDKYCLEGFLFPDTYEFYKNDSPETVLNKMLRNFDNRFSEELRDQIPTLNEKISNMMRRDGRGEEYIANHQMDIRKILIVASMVEKETASAQEGYNIASVIYNRLFAWNGTPAYLNIDAAIVYALDGKTDLTAEDKLVESPYNTYLNIGLTPGPIANPGLSSIKAALEPADTSYYFYVLDPSTGTHHFSRTLEEHEAFRASLRG